MINIYMVLIKRLYKVYFCLMFPPGFSMTIKTALHFIYEERVWWNHSSHSK